MNQTTKSSMKTNTKSSTYQISLIGIMAAITCILGPLSIPIPFSPVPISFTNLAIYFTVFILGWKRGTISYLIYLLIGLVGLPVFSGFSGGPGKLVGPTGGYLIGFIFMAIIGGFFIEKFSGKVFMYIIGLILATIVAYLLGREKMPKKMA
jgi:biotin transport system substrate-specific component